MNHDRFRKLLLTSILSLILSLLFILSILVFSLWINPNSVLEKGSPEKFLKLQQVLPIFLTTVMGLATFIMFFSLQILRSKFPISHGIATIGFPKSGKTTLITVLFNELFTNRLGIQTIPRGLETIERVNDNIAKLELGKSVGATTDKDVFAYRIDVIRRNCFCFKSYYKVEIGDFPGEDSQKFTEEFGHWFHHTPYFKWAMEADSFMFVVDLAPALVPTKEYGTPQEYVAKMTQAIRAAWQRLNEYHYEGQQQLSKKSVVLVFTKSDLFGITSEVNDLDAVTQEILKLGFDSIPAPNEIDAVKFKDGQETVLKMFADLISYMKNQDSRFQTIFVGCFSFEPGQRQQRLGIKKLLDAILPRG